MPQYSKQTLAEIAANQETLNNCPQHKFILKECHIAFGAKIQCENCKAHMLAVHAFSYTQGFEAAGANPNDVIPNFRVTIQ